MKTYEVLKQELQSRRTNIKGFNKAFYKQFSHDMEVIRRGLEEAKELDIDYPSVTEFWKQSETHKTWFYNHNSGAYCELLQICE